tara:strand:+ start:170 stop:1276 length:1107 start_codon:yes stop_codon:yes gene_type:complete
MANSTFSGAVRSQNNFKLVSKNTTTGLISDRTKAGGIRDTRRYYLEEYFYQLPKLNSYLTASETKDFGSIADGNEEAEEVTVTGAALGDFAVASIGVDATDLVVTAEVTASNTVTVVVLNNTGGAIDLASATLTVRVMKAGTVGSDANPNFEVLGTNMTTALCSRNTDRAGIILTTAGADEDQAILAPHLDSGMTAWTGTKWGTENQTSWECSINPNAIDNQKFWAGLKLTNDQLVATDANQAYFKFQTDATNSEAFDDFTLLHFVHSIGGTDFISALPITVAANTTYHLKIEIDSDRKLSIFVDGVQYNITSTSGSTGGTAVTTGTTKSGAMTDDIDLIPYIGIEAGAAAAEALDVHYQCISRTIFE